MAAFFAMASTLASMTFGLAKKSTQILFLAASSGEAAAERRSFSQREERSNTESSKALTARWRSPEADETAEEDEEEDASVAVAEVVLALVLE